LFAGRVGQGTLLPLAVNNRNQKLSGGRYDRLPAASEEETNMRGRTAAAVVTATSFVAVGLAVATAEAAADMELGRYLASECMTCHRGQTTANAIPNLTSMPREHFVTVIKAYRRKELPNPAMQNVASRLTDEEIESLALYFSTTKQP
jgi:cytochrome c